MILYHRPGSRSTRVRWVLEEVGLPYRIELVSRERARGEEHRARHPLGRVPVLQDDDGTLMFESAALCLHLADRAPAAGLIAEPGTRQRGLAYQWTFFAMAEIEPALVTLLVSRDSDPQRAERASQSAREASGVLEGELSGRQWLVGASFGVADIVAGSVLAFAQRLSLLEGMDSLAGYLARLEARPARQRAFATD